ncbi:MAG: LmbE family N-acetylglucosaminyl deacetylase [Gammaproteobacteria bacterium]|jgi:LmbE family N-acetylglucosaminyl deacetylase
MSSELTRYEAVVIAPHYDDAVFSCGGLIAESVKKGNVLVVNVFTNSEGGAMPCVVGDAERLAEEQAAGASLGFETRSFGFQDAALRRTGSHSTARLFSPPTESDVDLIKTIAAAFENILSSVTAEKVFAPLGVGWHIDHVLCHLAIRMVKPAAPMLFYEDAPYCFLKRSTAQRVAHVTSENLSFAKLSWRDFGDTWGRVRRTALAQSVPVLTRPIAELVIAKFLHSLPALQVGNAAELPLSEIKYDLSSHFDAKITACERYTSQVAEFFPNRSTMREFYLAHSRRVLPDVTYAERYWQTK